MSHQRNIAQDSRFEARSDMTVKILMIDDHPSQIEGYKVILGYNKENLRIETTPCFSCEAAYKIITGNTPETVFDIIFLDSTLPPYPEKKIHSGEDLAPLIKKHMPESKIVIITSHSETFLLYNIVKKIAPAGLLVKSDFDANDLLDAFEIIMNGENYHSETVIGSVRQLLSKEAYLDSFNRQIITLLSQGVRTKNLPDYLHISLSAVEKRKAQVKDYLCIDKGTDEDIVREARKLGFI
ncbi:MAG TPA: response regulator [Flavobacterium sp.]|nr:response regulator [Flavobacterium sp.]